MCAYIYLNVSMFYIKKNKKSNTGKKKKEVQRIIEIEGRKDKILGRK